MSSGSVDAKRLPSVLVLTGAGNTFCPGADLNTVGRPTDDPEETAEAVHFQVPVLLHTMPQLTIAPSSSDMPIRGPMSRPAPVMRGLMSRLNPHSDMTPTTGHAGLIGGCSIAGTKWPTSV